jgi:two-component system chemotaxis family response regulator WspR
VPLHSSVLLAHFDAAERERLTRFLRDGGAEVAVAASGAEALELAPQSRPTLALVSCMLPGISGFEVCRQLEEGFGALGPVPVVLLSDAEDPYIRARARHVGARRVLFGSVPSAQVKELLSASWDAVDSLELAAASAGGMQEEHLLKDVLSARPQPSGESLLAKVTDPLTGLVNAEYLTLKIEEECKRAARYNHPLCLLLVEVKSFDQLVEKHGRTTGDEVLLEVAGVLLCESRDVDVAGRVGASRFHLLLPNTPADGARILARRIEENLRQRVVVAEGTELPIEVRMGLAIAEREVARAGAGEFVRHAELDLSSAQLATDGIGTLLRGQAPVEPMDEGASTRKETPAG